MRYYSKSDFNGHSDTNYVNIFLDKWEKWKGGEFLFYFYNFKKIFFAVIFSPPRDHVITCTIYCNTQLFQ